MQAIVKKIETLSSRERLLLFLTIISTIYYIWSALVLDNVLAAKQQLAQEAESITKNIPGLQKRMQEISRSAANNPNKELSNKVEELKQENINLEKNIMGVTQQLIPAEQMAALLGDIIAADRDLSVTKIENIAEEPVFAQGDEHGSKNMGNLQIYRHGLALEFDATYFATRKFLQALEALPWKIVLGELDYKVGEYPHAKVRIVIYTLSLQKAWLGM